MSLLSVVASGDFLNPDSSPAYPGFDFSPLQENPAISFRFLETSAVITPDQIRDADTLINSGAHITAGTFHPNSKLALIAQFGAGFDHIDLVAATKNHVAVTNTPTGVRRPMAVTIMTLILALVTKFPIKSQLSRRGPQGWAEAAAHRGTGLTGKTLASIGLGNIASDLFRLMKPLDMRFIAHDPYGNPATARKLSVELVPLDQAFAQADILCVNTPLTLETRHLVNAERLSLMKPTAYFLNTSRGPVVDQRALTEVLSSKRIAGAALDVFQTEPLPDTDPLVGCDNVILTPHSLCWTDEFYEGCGRETVAVIMDFMAGRAPKPIVNRDILNNASWIARLAQRK
jgi:phosphoglycerate dehydrogenase-like enzyme